MWLSAWEELRGLDIGLHRTHSALPRAEGDLRAWILPRVEQGLLHRQEAVSMLPPLCLDVRCSHKVFSHALKGQPLTQETASKTDEKRFSIAP